jgi:hypothetical protein
MSSTEIELEDLEGLVSPPGINLDDASLARSLPLVITSLAVQQTSSDYFNEFISNEANVDALPLLESFQQWTESNIAQGIQPWLEYLALSRSEVLRNFWSAYDPDNLSANDDGVRELPGDDLLGVSLLFHYLESTGLLSELDAQRWTNVWQFLTFTDLIAIDDVDTVEESADPTEGNDEW